MSEKIRMLRVLEYTGTREAVERAIKERGVKGQINTPDLTIREAILGDVLEQLPNHSPTCSSKRTEPGFPGPCDCGADGKR